MINLFYLCHFLECGHFCIRYVLKKEKKKLNIFYDRSMMSFLLIKKIMGEYFGFVECYRIENIDQLRLKSRCLTFIKVRKKYNHYVVIERVDEQYVYYYDPLFLFLKKKKKNKFILKWGNICCFYE